MAQSELDSNSSLVPGLEGDEAGSRLVGEELRLWQTVREALEAAVRPSTAAADARVTDDMRLIELRDEVAVAKPEDLPALFEQMHTVGAIRAQRGKGAVGGVDRQCPYFGHLRLEEQGKRRDILLGPRSYVDSACPIRIVDWRHAPVSRIFYRYREGDDYDEELGGRMVEGTVVTRRSVAIVKGELVRITSQEAVFVRQPDAVSWRRVHAREARLQTPVRCAAESGVAERQGRAGDRLRDAPGDRLLPAIAAMLDKDQFDLITRPNAGVIAIQGSAGSGKTTVGLHRAAYLAFADPARYRPDRMLVVVPHDALMHYVARVLPSLGVEGVPIVTFGDYGIRLLSGILPDLPASYTEETPPVVVRAKRHAAMAKAIEEAARRVTAWIDGRLREQMAKWPRGEDAVAAWEATGVAPAVPDARVTALVQWLAGKRKLEGVPMASDLPSVTAGALERLGRELRRASRDVVGTWDSLLTSRPRLDATFSGVFGPGQIERIHDWCTRRSQLRMEGERDGELASLDQEDAALLLRCWQVLRGPVADAGGNPVRFAHMFIDEVQDASPVELCVLVNLTSADRSVTLAGDTAQRLGTPGDDSGEFDWTETLDLLGVHERGTAKVDALHVSYRATAEITRFSQAILGSLAHASEPIATRHGPPVELFSFSAIGEAVAWIGDALKELAIADPDANVALIARFPQQADAYFEGLARAELPGVRRVSMQDFTWSPGFDVTDVRQTKGLEFDEGVLLETSASSYPDEPAARHALYVGATRAAHQLWCVTSGPPSPVVVEALRQASEESAVPG